MSISKRIGGDLAGGDAELPEEVHSGPEVPRCLAIAEAGIGTGSEYAAFMSTIMGDLVSGRISPSAGNAAVNAGGKLLKVVEMQFKYGTPRSGRKDIDLVLDMPAIS